MKIYNLRIRSSVHGQTNLCTLSENKFNISASEFNGICVNIVTIMISHNLGVSLQVAIFDVAIFYNVWNSEIRKIKWPVWFGTNKECFTQAIVPI